MTELREALETAFEESEKEEEEVIEDAVQEPEEKEQEEQKEEEVEEKAEEPEEEEVEEKTEEEVEEVEEEVEEEPEEEEDTTPPPNSWKAAAREQWKDLPKGVKDEVLRREEEIVRGLQGKNDAKKFKEEFDQTIRPFEQFIAADGHTPIESVKNLMQTAAGLRVGTPVQKAQIVAKVINDFGIDIQTLDTILSGQPAPENDVRGVVRQELAPIIQNLEKQREDLRGTNEEKMQNEIDAFMRDPKNEFVNDVVEDMATILDINAARGKELTLAEAYEQACRYNPEIQKVISMRSEKDRVKVKKKAAVSISGSPSGPKAPKTSNDTIRGAIENALESVSDR